MYIVKDLSSIKDTKINLSFEISKDNLTIAEALKVFKVFSRYKSNYISSESFPDIKEKEGNIIISYYTCNKDFEKEHKDHLYKVKSGMQSVTDNNNFEIIEATLNYNVDDGVYSKLIKELESSHRETPYKEEDALKWFKENISKDVLAIDFLVNGKRAYIYSFTKKDNVESIRITPYSMKSCRFNSVVPDNEDVFISIKKVSDTYKNLIDKLGITSYPISGFDDRFISKIFDDEPKYFTKLFGDNQMYQKAIKYYEMSNKSKSFWKKILKEDDVMKRLDNPLHKENEDKLTLFLYNIDCEYYYSEDYESYYRDGYERYLSLEELDIEKIKSFYLNNEGIEDYRSLNVNEEKFYSGRDTDTFIEVDKDDGHYITRPANYRFKQLI